MTPIQNEKQGASRNNIRTEEHLIRLLEDMEATDDVKLFRRIMSTVSARIKRRRRRAMMYAAAVIIPIFIISGTILFMFRERQHGTIITPASGEVTLTIAYGEEIVLDRATDTAVIVDENDLLIGHEDGRLIVRNKGGNETDVLMPVSSATVSVPRGAQFDITLEDGTRVWLNSDSRLTFPTRFIGPERRVRLEGEGYFEVAGDRTRPFVAEAAGQMLTVLGTSFNISAYGEEGVIYTTVVTGSVRLRSEATGESAVLVPGQQARLGTGGGGFTTRLVDTSEVISWRKRRLVFDESTLGEVMMKLSRWYNFEYSFEDPAARDLVVRGSIPVYDDMNKALEMIEAMGMATFGTERGHVTVSFKE